MAAKAVSPAPVVEVGGGSGSGVERSKDVSTGTGKPTRNTTVLGFGRMLNCDLDNLECFVTDLGFDATVTLDLLGFVALEDFRAKMQEICPRGVALNPHPKGRMCPYV